MHFNLYQQANSERLSYHCNNDRESTAFMVDKGISTSGNTYKLHEACYNCMLTYYSKFWMVALCYQEVEKKVENCHLTLFYLGFLYPIQTLLTDKHSSMQGLAATVL